MRLWQNEYIGNVFQHVDILTVFLMAPRFYNYLPLNQKTSKQNPQTFLCFLFKYFGDFLASIFISLKKMYGSQLLSAGVCTHLFVYFLKCNWEYA